jgi:rare lipoprotein A
MMSELALILALILTPGARAQQAKPEPPKVEPVVMEQQAKTKPAKKKTQQQATLDRSGQKKKGKASYYGGQFAGKTMANGEPMNPKASTAASRTLPLGTRARVTNLQNNRSAEVEITDRGPYVAGRTIDVTPKVADDLGMKKDGIAAVEVAPLRVPQADGSLKTGEGASSVGASSSTPAATETAR